MSDGVLRLLSGDRRSGPRTLPSSPGGGASWQVMLTSGTRSQKTPRAMFRASLN
jgi:hypothetical protein